MKKFILAISLTVSGLLSAQSEKPANVYLSNLEENMYFGKYNAQTGQITGGYFMVLADGDNSKDYTPAFELTIYLLPKGSTNAEDIIVIKKYDIKGLYHMGSMEYKNETFDLKDLQIPAGTYRVGVWVNSNTAFTENDQDNAMLFKDAIEIGTSSEAKPQSIEEQLLHPKSGSETPESKSSEAEEETEEEEDGFNF